MTLARTLLRKSEDPSLGRDERARLRCRAAEEFERGGQYEAARDALAELWRGVGRHPATEGLSELTAAEVLLRAGTLSGRFAGGRDAEGARGAAKGLIAESVAHFRSLGAHARAASGLSELAHLHRREGVFDEARAAYAEALGELRDVNPRLKAEILIGLSKVEYLSGRPNDALRILTDADAGVEASESQALKGDYHGQLGRVLTRLGRDERRPDYTARAVVEYQAAGRHFERAGHTRRQALVESELGSLLGKVKRFPEAHRHLDRAQALSTGLRDGVGTARVDEARAKVLLAEGRAAEAERLARSAAQTLEREGEQSPLAQALTTQGAALARAGSHERARLTLRRAGEAAEAAGDPEAAGLAALAALEELAEHLTPQDLCTIYDRAAGLLSGSGDRESNARLLAASRRVMFHAASLAAPPTWEGFDFFDAVRRFEARLIERALADAGGVVAHAARLLGMERRSLDAMLHKGRHKALAALRRPAEPRRSSLMFRDDEDRDPTRAVSVLHVEDEGYVAEAVRMTLEKEGWSVEECGDGSEALERLESGARYDVLIIDDRLPGLGGVDLVRRARALAHRQQTPIIMFAGEGEVEMQARRAGANAFLRKPDDLSMLAETIARMLARGRRRR
jgi:CheY-like chemotaxis protein